MIRPFAIGLVLAAIAAPAAAQAPLSLADAIARARAQNPGAAAAAAAEREAAERVTQARAGYLPRVDVSEAWQRGNQPVFVFSSLLGQRRFTAADFALPALNHPAAMDNFRTAIVAEQTLFDGATRATASSAALSLALAASRRQGVDLDLASTVSGAYGRVLAAAAARRSAAAAIESARADRELAGNRRDAGMATDADVLQLDVYVARTREQEIRAASDERTARAELNQLLGEPLGTMFTLDPVAAAAVLDTTDLPALEAESIANRPEVQAAILEERLARSTFAAAKSAFLPQVVAQGGWEFNGGTWDTRASSWVLGAAGRINVFHGFADKARLAESREQIARRGLERQSAETAARLDVYRAAARLDAARAREAVGHAVAAQARESRRIIRDRYESGMADITSLLRANESVVEAETRQTAAAIDVLTETAALQRALGRR